MCPRVVELGVHTTISQVPLPFLAFSRALPHTCGSTLTDGLDPSPKWLWVLPRDDRGPSGPFWVRARQHEDPAVGAEGRMACK